jgi:hypothetical protein
MTRCLFLEAYLFKRLSILRNQLTKPPSKNLTWISQKSQKRQKTKNKTQIIQKI